MRVLNERLRDFADDQRYGILGVARLAMREAADALEAQAKRISQLEATLATLHETHKWTYGEKLRLEATLREIGKTDGGRSGERARNAIS